MANTLPTIERLLNDKEQIITFPGTSQYAFGSSSGCGLAAVNAVKIIFSREADGLRGQDLLGVMFQRKIMEECISICAGFNSQAHMELEDIHTLPLFKTSMRLTAKHHGTPVSGYFESLLRRLQRLSARKGCSAVVITRPPETLVCFYIPLCQSAEEVHVIFDSHPRPSHPRGAAFICNVSRWRTVKYLTDVFQIDGQLLYDIGNLQWEAQLLEQVVGNFFVPTGEQLVLSNAAADIMVKSNLELLALKSQSQELSSHYSHLTREIKSVRDHGADMLDRTSAAGSSSSWNTSAHSVAAPSLGASDSIEIDSSPLKQRTARVFPATNDRSLHRSQSESPSQSESLERRETTECRQAEIGQACTSYPNLLKIHTPEGLWSSPPSERGFFANMFKLAAGGSRAPSPLVTSPAQPTPGGHFVLPASFHTESENNPSSSEHIRSQQPQDGHDGHDPRHQPTGGTKARVDDKGKQRASEHEVVRAKFDCEICKETFPTDFVAEVEECSHQFCRDCLRKYSCIRIRERCLPIQCPQCIAVKSGSEFTVSVINDDLVQQLGVSEEDYAIFVEAQMSYLSVRVQCRKCQAEFFAYREDFDDMQFLPCPQCRHIWCKLCQQPVDINGRKHVCDTGLDAFNKLVAENGWKACPGCKIPTEKISGCNHMTCTAPGCRTEFCYRCGKKWKTFWKGCRCPP